MKIIEIRIVEIELKPKPTTPPRTPSRSETYQLNRPVTRYPVFDNMEEKTHFLFGLEPSRLPCNSRRWDLGFRSLTLRGSRGPNHYRSPCPVSRW